MTHDVAAYSFPITPYVAFTGSNAIGPKFVPFTVTIVPPTVGMLDAPPKIVRLVMLGAVYDVCETDKALSWPPTRTFHARFAPIPGKLVHWIWVFGTRTVHPDAGYLVPVTPYVTTTAGPVEGPKFVPVNVIVVPPLVGIVVTAPASAIEVIFGTVYDVVATDTWLG